MSMYFGYFIKNVRKTYEELRIIFLNYQLKLKMMCIFNQKIIKKVC